jgi:hypothetical protein
MQSSTPSPTRETKKKKNLLKQTNKKKFNGRVEENSQKIEFKGQRK